MRSTAWSSDQRVCAAAAAAATAAVELSDSLLIRCSCEPASLLPAVHNKAGGRAQILGQDSRASDWRGGAANTLVEVEAWGSRHPPLSLSPNGAENLAQILPVPPSFKKRPAVAASRQLMLLNYPLFF